MSKNDRGQRTKTFARRSSIWWNHSLTIAQEMSADGSF